MAILKIKATYSLDAETMRLLERAARRLRVSKSEVLRRAIHGIAASPVGDDPRLEALDQLHASGALSPAAAETWVRDARSERRVERAGATVPTATKKPAARRPRRA